jgi:hypothetical protein
MEFKPEDSGECREWVQGIPGGFLTLGTLTLGWLWDWPGDAEPPLPCRIISSTWSLRDSNQGRASVRMTPSWTQLQPLSVSVPTLSVSAI